MATLEAGIVGARGGGLISMLTSLLTLRFSQRAERARWAADRRWKHASGLASARREVYARFLSQQNAVILAAGGAYAQAARLSTDASERRYLAAQAKRLSPGRGPMPL